MTERRIVPITWRPVCSGDCSVCLDRPQAWQPLRGGQPIAPTSDPPAQTWELGLCELCIGALSLAMGPASPLFRVFRVSDGSTTHAATAAELRAANGGDRAILEWLEVAKVGDAFDGYHTLRVERIR